MKYDPEVQEVRTMGRNLSSAAIKMNKASKVETPVVVQSETDTVLENAIQASVEQENATITVDMAVSSLCQHEQTNVQAALEHGKLLYRGMLQQATGAAQKAWLDDVSLKCRRNGYNLGFKSLRGFAILYWLSVEFKSMKNAPSLKSLERFAPLAKVKDGSFMMDVHTSTDRKEVDTFIHEACTRTGQFEIAKAGTTNPNAVDSGDYEKKITRFVARFRGEFDDYGRNEAEYKEIKERAEKAKEEQKVKDAMAQTQAEELAKNPSLFMRDVCLGVLPRMERVHLEYLRNTLNVLLESTKPANPENSI